MCSSVSHLSGCLISVGLINKQIALLCAFCVYGRLVPSFRGARLCRVSCAWVLVAACVVYPGLQEGARQFATKIKVVCNENADTKLCF